jgi:hypothetical protein
MRGNEYEALERQITSSTREAAFYRPGSTDRSAWFAVRPLNEPETQELGGVTPLRDKLLGCQVVGFASAKNDVSGSWLEQVMKRRRHPEKVYAAVSDVDVRSDQQRQRIGTAIFYFSLGMFRPDQKPTTYVMGANEELEESLRGLGYRVTGSHTREDVVAGVEIEEARLQADSVREVRGLLMEQFSWLAEAQPITRKSVDNY